MDDKLMITDDMLVAWLDGEAPKDVADTIAANPEAYAERLELLKTADAELRHKLAAFTRPTSLQIGEYHLGLGSAEQRAAIAAYLQLHPHAQRQLDLLDDFLGELEPQEAVATTPGLLAQARVLVARLIGDGSARPALAMGLRGAQEGVYDAGSYQVVVESDTDLDDPERMALSGLLTGQEDDDRLIVSLWRVRRRRSTCDRGHRRIWQFYLCPP